ncbi:MAG: hypothetical protein JEZ11_02915 [Desulfobacterales bacterium]|nr:hypothetical protein [Desulfobacterales bacterium]
MSEQRKLDRYHLPIPTRIAPLDAGGDDGSLYFVTADVCAGGAFFQTKRSLPQGMDVDLEMSLPLDRFRSFRNSVNRVCIRIHGTVLRTASHGMAIQFNGQHQYCGQAD